MLACELASLRQTSSQTRRKESRPIRQDSVATSSDASHTLCSRVLPFFLRPFEIEVRCSVALGISEQRMGVEIWFGLSLSSSLNQAIRVEISVGACARSRVFYASDTHRISHVSIVLKPGGEIAEQVLSAGPWCSCSISITECSPDSPRTPRKSQVLHALLAGCKWYSAR